MTKKKNADKKERSQNALYYRLIEIDSEIARGRFPNSTTLSEQYEVSVSTIKRDIEYMRDMFNAPILYDKDRNGYYYENKTFRLPAMFTSEKELFSGAIALKLLAQYKTTPIYKHLENIFGNFYKVLTDEKVKNKTWIENRIVFIEETAPTFSSETWERITKAVIENRYITFLYKSPYTNAEREGYHIAPYQLICKSGVWYLAGYSDRKDCVSLYALHRMKSIKITDDHFEMDENYKHYKSTNKLFGVYAFDKELKCKVQFFNETANYIGERVWAENQKIIKKKDGSIVMSFSSGQLYEVLKFILAQGSNALPLEPKSLVDAWKDELAKMCERLR